MHKGFGSFLICVGLVSVFLCGQLRAAAIEELATVEVCCQRLTDNVILDLQSKNDFFVTFYGFDGAPKFPEFGYHGGDLAFPVNLSHLAAPFILVVYVPFGFDFKKDCLSCLDCCRNVYVMRCVLLRDAIIDSRKIVDWSHRLHEIPGANCLDECVNGFYWDRELSGHNHEGRIGCSQATDDSYLPDN